MTCGAELLGNGAGEVVCDALDLFKSSDGDALCCLDVCLVAISFVVDGLTVGGRLAAWLMLDPCLLLKDAFLLIVFSTSVNECNLLAVDAVATLDAGCSSSLKSSKSSSSLLSSLLCLDVFVGLVFLFLEEAVFVMFVFVEKRILVKWKFLLHLTAINIEAKSHATIYMVASTEAGY